MSDYLVNVSCGGQCMIEIMMKEVENLFPGRIFLTLEEVALLLHCDSKTIYNWTKRANPKRRPPRILVGKSLRFPKAEFLRRLAEEQTGKNDILVSMLSFLE